MNVSTFIIPTLSIPDKISAWLGKRNNIFGHVDGNFFSLLTFVLRKILVFRCSFRPYTSPSLFVCFLFCFSFSFCFCFCFVRFCFYRLPSWHGVNGLLYVIQSLFSIIQQQPPKNTTTITGRIFLPSTTSTTAATSQQQALATSIPSASGLTMGGGDSSDSRQRTSGYGQGLLMQPNLLPSRPSPMNPQMNMQFGLQQGLPNQSNLIPNQSLMYGPYQGGVSSHT